MVIDWNLLAPAMRSNPGEQFNASFERGMAQGALGRLRRDPNDRNALNALMMANPALALQMEERAHRMGERDRLATGRDMTAHYLLGGDNLGSEAGLTAPATAALPGRPQPAPSALSGSTGSPTGQGALSGLTPGAPAPLGANANALLGGVPPGFGVTAAQARERAIRADPETFLESEGGNTQNARQRVQLSQEQFELMRDLNEQTLQLLGGIGQVPEGQRQAAWEAALQRAEGLYSRFGMNVREHVPAQYDPATYDQLMRSAMKTRDQFAVMSQEDRLEWDIEDDRIDNTRADRGLESLDRHRQGQRSLTARGQDLTHSRGLRGQDIASGDRRRGQDLSDTRGRRGQDMTDARGRRGQDMRGAGRGGRGRGGAGNNARAMLNGRPIVVRGNRWVYEDNGQPAQ